MPVVGWVGGSAGRAADKLGDWSCDGLNDREFVVVHGR
jgi:hypothetical protein